MVLYKKDYIELIGFGVSIAKIEYVMNGIEILISVPCSYSWPLQSPKKSAFQFEKAIRRANPKTSIKVFYTTRPICWTADDRDAARRQVRQIGGSRGS